MPTFDTSFKSIAHAGGRVRKTSGGKFVGERSDGGRIRRQTFETEKEAKSWLSDLGARPQFRALKRRFGSQVQMLFRRGG